VKKISNRQFLVVVLFCFHLGSLAAQTEAIQHKVSFSDRQSQYADVSLQLAVSSEQTELAMPNWIPGSYLIRDFAGQLERFQAFGENDQALMVEKTAKNRWTINTAGVKTLRVQYSVWAGELGVRANYVSPDFALLNGAGLFLYNEETRDLPQTVAISLPDTWSKIYTSLVEDGESYLAQNYDELVDSPFLLGNAPSYAFNVDEQDYLLVNQGETAMWDGSKSAQDVASVVSAAQNFWGTNPLDRAYVFLNIIAQGGGGIEHDYSTVLMTDRWRMKKRQEYIGWLSLVSHEFFHVWNVRRMRPQALIRYNYEQETHTRELWLAEGITSYYGNLLLARSGLITVEEYLAELAGGFHQYETRLGSQIQTVEQASFDTWVKAYKPTANSRNSTVSYYGKGSLIGFVTDMLIRQKTDHRFSLDDLMRKMYEQYGPAGSKGRGYPPGTFENLLEEMTDADTRQWVESWLDTTSDPDIDLALQWYGLELERFPARSAALEADKPEPVDFGLIWSSDSTALVVESVINGGAAAQTGILPGDEILAINQERVNKGNIEDIITRLVVGDTAEFLLARHGLVLPKFDISPSPATSDKYLITVSENIDENQKSHLSAWLATELDFDPE
jgi:predicted metalloprotease with PDZ domain